MRFSLETVGPRRPPRGKEEASLQVRLMADLEWLLPPGAFAWHTPNGGSRDPREGANLKRQGVKAGIPDILICWAGKIFGLELKAQSGRISDSQAEVFPLLRAAGMRIEIARSHGEAIERIREMGIPLRSKPQPAYEVRDVFREETKRRPRL